MRYVFDTNSFIVIGHYFPERFPSFWAKFDALVAAGRVLSVREVLRELDNHNTRLHLRNWIDANQSVFLVPTPQETQFVSQIFAVPHFQNLLSKKQILAGGPAADPFVIALAKVVGCCVVTEESKKDNAARIPNVCEHFGLGWTNLEGLMQSEGWCF